VIFVVERYLPGLARSDLLEVLERLAAPAHEQGVEADVRYLGSTIVLADDACFCQFEGPSREAVATANERVGAPFDRIVSTVSVRPRAPAKRG